MTNSIRIPPIPHSSPSGGWCLCGKRQECRFLEENDVRGSGDDGNALATRCTNGTVTLHRLVLVFYGGNCMLSEEE